MDVIILGSGGGAPSPTRETSCVLVRDGDSATIWAPGQWLYDTDSAALPASLWRPPVAPSDLGDIFPIEELSAGSHAIGPFELRASAQPRHWAPSAGLRVDDELAFVTDTPYEPSRARLAANVDHLLHEAWSSSRLPLQPDRDATAADAARVAVEAGAKSLTLIHRNPTLEDRSALLADAAAIFEPVALGEDGLLLAREGLAGPRRPN